MHQTRPIVFTLLLCFLAPTHAAINNISQTTGPFGSIDEAMLTAQPGDFLAVEGTAGGGEFTVPGCQLSGQFSLEAIVYGPVRISVPGIRLLGLTFDGQGLGDQPVIQVVGSEMNVVFTAIKVVNGGNLSTPAHGVVIGDGSGPINIEAIDCEFGPNFGSGLVVDAPDSRVKIEDCMFAGNGLTGLDILSDRSTIEVTGCDLASNGGTGLGIEGDGHTLNMVGTEFGGNLQSHLDLNGNFSTGEVMECDFVGAASHGILIRGGTNSFLFNKCDLGGGAGHAFRCGGSSGNSLILRDLCIFGWGRRTVLMEASSGPNTLVMRHCTAHNNFSGIVNAAGLPSQPQGSAIDIQYCVFSLWDATQAAFQDFDDDAVFVENFNLCAPANATLVVRTNVTKGAGTADTLGGSALNNLYCTTNVMDPNFLKTRKTSLALGVGGSTRLAGAKELCGIGNPIVRISDRAEFASVQSANSSGGTITGSAFIVSGIATGGRVSKNGLIFRGPGEIQGPFNLDNGHVFEVDAQSIILDRLNVTSRSGIPSNRMVIRRNLTATWCDIRIREGITSLMAASAIDLTRCKFMDTRISVECQNLNMIDCEMEGGDSDLRLVSTNGISLIANSRIRGSANRGVEAVLTESTLNILNSSIEGEASHGVIILGNKGTVGLSGVRLQARRGAYFSQMTGGNHVLSDCVFEGSEPGIDYRMTVDGHFAISDSLFLNNKQAVRIDGRGSGAIFSMEGCTLHNNAEGIEIVGDTNNSNTGNSFSLKYNVISEWDETGSPPAYGVFDVKGNALIDHDYNVYLDTTDIGSAALNMYRGGRTYDLTDPSFLYCSVNPLSLSYLHIGANSPAADIDRKGRNAGCKPVSCLVNEEMVSAVHNWRLYDGP